MSDRYGLERFVEAQENIYEKVCAELRAGQKWSCWMWFVFPQIRGLGNSSMSITYAISGLDEARAYMEHPVLGVRLRECTEIVLSLEGKGVAEIFGYPDNLKFHSSMTLFARAAEGERVFEDVLKKYFSGKMDDGTLSRI